MQVFERGSEPLEVAGLSESARKPSSMRAPSRSDSWRGPSLRSLCHGVKLFVLVAKTVDGFLADGIDGFYEIADKP